MRSFSFAFRAYRNLNQCGTRQERFFYNLGL